jgi:hypothetical protein
MVKNHTHDQVTAVLQELEKQTDRGAGIIAAAVLEEILEIVLRKRLLKLSNRHADELFGPMKALSSFSAKIEIGFALGLFSEAGYRHLNVIRDVRNKFAHRIAALTFDHPDIAKIIDEGIFPKPSANIKKRDAFLGVWRVLAVLLYAENRDDIRIQSLSQTHPKLFNEVARVVEGALTLAQKLAISTKQYAPPLVVSKRGSGPEPQDQA